MRVACIGELVIDLIATTPVSSIQDAKQFAKCPGGSPANVAAGLYEAGVEVILISRVGSDGFGRYLKKMVENVGISTQCITFDEQHPTRCVFISHDELGRRSIEIANRHSADQFIRKREVAAELTGLVDVLHIGGTTLLNEMTSGAMLAFTERVKREGGIVSFDPNINLKRIPGTTIERLMQLLPFVDLLKVNDDEWAALQMLLSKYTMAAPPFIVCTHGAKGASIMLQSEVTKIHANRVEVRDVTGAGDAFFSGFLGYLIQHTNDLLGASPALLKQSGQAGSRAAAKVIQAYGGALAQAVDNPPEPRA